VTLFIVLAVLAAPFFLFLGSRLWVQFSPGRAIQRNRAELTPVDLEAFENLTDPDEEQFLRMHLSPPEFRRVQRLRIRAAKLYIAALSQNASVLIAVGQAARLNAEPEIIAIGQDLIQRAIRLKFFCLFSLLRMEAAIAFPVLLSPSQKLAHQYMMASYMAANLPGRAAA
jgi:hypothetical protein